MSDVWLEPCSNCGKETLHRFLDCDEHRRECTLIVCCECGGSE